MSEDIGRPSKYKPEYCQMLINHMAGGLSFESFAAVIDVHRDTLYEWDKAHDDFSDAKKKGIDKSLIFWEKLGLSGITGANKNIKNFGHATYIFTMKNRFKWTDRVEHAGDDIKPIMLSYNLEDNTDDTSDDNEI